MQCNLLNRHPECWNELQWGHGTTADNIWESLGQEKNSDNLGKRKYSSIFKMWKRWFLKVYVSGFAFNTYLLRGKKKNFKSKLQNNFFFFLIAFGIVLTLTIITLVQYLNTKNESWSANNTIFLFEKVN